MKIARSRSDRALFAQPMHSSAYSRYSFAVAMARSLARAAVRTGCQKPTQVAWRQDYDLVTWDQAASPLFSAFAPQEMSIAPQRLLPGVR